MEHNFFKSIREFLDMTFIDLHQSGLTEGWHERKDDRTAVCPYCKRRGGIALKFVSPGFGGMPDRLVLFPDGRMGFVEVKAPGKKARPLQVSRHRMLTKMGFKVYVLDQMDGIEVIIDDIRAT